jgi:large conductance mechanosensitive channel
MLTEIRDILAEQEGRPKETTLPGTGPSPDSAETTSADKS